MGGRLLRHPVAAQPLVCGECRCFDIPTAPALEEYLRGGAVSGSCRRFAPCMEPGKPMYPRVWSDYPVCDDALGALPGERTGPLA